MHLVSPLASGIYGAEEGLAFVRRRGVSALASVYSDFYGTVLAQPATGLVLGANGELVIYVNELVDVEVQDAEGNVVRSFTEGEAAPNVEVISPSFTGRDYETGAAAVNKPTTLQAVLDKWAVSAGAPDFSVNFAGVSTSLEDAIGAVAGIFRSVMSPAYGATGNGTTDDTVAIQAAISAGEGIVWFPEGSYRTTAKLTVPVGVSLWGPGASQSTIGIDHATAACLEYGVGASGSYQEIRGLGLAALQANSGALIHLTTAGSRRVAVISCNVGANTSTADTILCAAASVNTAYLLIDRSQVVAGGDTDTRCVSAAETTVRVLLRDSVFVAIGSSGSWSGTLTYCRNMVASNCVFDTATSVTSGTYSCVLMIGTAGAGPTGAITGCTFLSGAGTNAAIALSGYNEATTRFSEAGNIFGAGFDARYSGNTAQTNRPQVWTAGRDQNTYNVTDNSASVAVFGEEYGTAVLTRSAAGAGAQTVTSNIGPEGAILTVIVYNGSGGGLAGAVGFGTGFVAGIPTVNPGNGKTSAYSFKSAYSAGAAVWVPMGAAVTTT